jgi:hypothetical protein
VWICPKCNAKVDPALEVCWRCGTTPAGLEDPDFVRADEAGPIETQRLMPGLKLETDAGDELTTDVVGPGAADLVECYLARDVVQARYLAEQLTGRGIPAVADTQDLRLRGAGAAVTNPLAAGHPYFGPRVWVRKDNWARARAWLEEYELSHGDSR